MNTSETTIIRPVTYAKSKFKLFLTIPPEKRTPTQIDEMVDLVMTLDIHFLKQYHSTNKLQALCAAISFKTVTAKTTIFEQGDDGDALYCVFSGAVSLYHMSKDENGNPKRTLFTQILPYDVIGELSLLYDQKRTATAIADEDSELLVLEKKLLNTILKGDDGINRLEAHIKALRNFSLLQVCSDAYLKRIAAKCFTNKFRTFTVVISQGQKPDGIYFIKSGKVKILRKIEFLTIYPLTYSENPELIRDPTRYEINDSKTEAKLIEIDELGPGEMFGDLAVLSDRPVQFTAVTNMPSELVLIETKDILGPQSELKRRIREIVKTYPPDEHFRRLYYKNTLWNNYKKSLVNKVLAEKQAKKGSSFRSATPLQKRNPIKFCYKEQGLYRQKTTLNEGYTKLPPIYNIYCMIEPKINLSFGEDGKPSSFLNKYRTQDTSYSKE